MRSLNLPEGPKESLDRFVRATHHWLAPDTYLLGGGTALAARWGHRHSTDVDLFIADQTLRAALRDAPDTARNSLRALTTAPSERYEIGIDYIEVTLQSGPVSVLTLPPKLADPPSHDRADATPVALESTAEIVARKLHNRVIHDGRYTPRDFYDFVYARRWDEPAWIRATTAVTERQWRTIGYAVQHLHQRWGLGAGAILEPADQDLAHNLRAHTLRLTEACATSARSHHRTRGPL